MKKTNLIFLMLATTLFAQNELKLLTTVHGEKDGDAFSFIDAIGDVNGDGYDDFIVGGNTGEYVKLYFGGSPFDTLDYIKFLQGTWRCVSVSGCGKGDLNGDGYNDFVINTAYWMNDERVEIYYGGKDKKIYDTPDLIITSDDCIYRYGGRSISGDLNGDGYDDLVISGSNVAWDDTGRVCIYFGGREMDTVCDVFLKGKESFDMFGYSSSIIGDINGDGFDDLLVGAPQSSKNKPGKAYLFFGGKEIGYNNCVEFVGDNGTREYGKFVSGLGDINGDGFKDFGIASQNYANIILGTNNINSNFVFNIYINNGISFMGGLYDINNDGYDDYVIVRRDIDIYWGPSILDTIPDISFDFWANPVCNLGDINGDNKDEIAFGIGGGWDSRGRVEIYSYEKMNSIEEFFNIIPTDYIINQNYPNPFNSVTNIRYKLNKELVLTIDVFDVYGKRIKEIFTGIQPSGEYTITWNSTNELNSKVASGVYFMRFVAKHIAGDITGNQKIIKMILLK